MTEKDVENEFSRRERALWPDEPSPFEDPFKHVAVNPEAEMRGEELSSLDPAYENEILEIRHDAPFDLFSEPATTRESTEPVNEVWLNGPPPDEFPFLQTPAASSPVSEPWPDQLRPFEPPFVPVVYTPESTEESVRRSGLAWSAGIVFFGAVAFMLFLGWLADLVLGSTPWGIVVGVVLGSVIGFIQFFRISSQIYAPKNQDHRPFLSRDDDME